MPCGPRLQLKGEEAHNVPLSKWAEAWHLPFFSPELQVLTMSICCCLFFRDYGSSKRKSGERHYFFPAFITACLKHKIQMFYNKPSLIASYMKSGEGGIHLSFSAVSGWVIIKANFGEEMLLFA